jgi:ATP-dependent RNA helicase DeaD
VSILLVPNSRRRKAEEMLRRARVEYTWGEAPTAADIRKQDEERLLQSALLTDEANEDDLTMADALIAAHGPRAAAAAFVKMYRATLPPPEDVGEPESQHRGEPRQQREPRAAREHGEGRPQRGERPRGPNRAERRAEKFGHETVAPSKPRGLRQAPASDKMQNGVWFKLSVGRERNADPKWLLPEICRQGEIQKSDIGSIRVYERETRFEVSPDVAERFATLVADRKKGGVRIFPAPTELPLDAEDRPRRPRGDGDFRDKKPFKKKRDFGGKPKHKTPRD